MKSLIILSVYLAVAYGYSVNVVLPGSGRNVYVDCEDLLEEAVELELRGKGVTDIDFDEVYKQPGVYAVEIESTSTSSVDAMNLLKSSLKNLGFYDATVKGGLRRSRPDYFGRIEDRFLVYFNVDTLEKTLSSFSLRILQNSDISIENSYEWY